MIPLVLQYFILSDKALLDTSTDLCTVAVGLDKQYQSSKMLSRRHNDEIYNDKRYCAY